jgi:hypothetical protein
MIALLSGRRTIALLAVLLASACVLAACSGKSAGSSPPSSPASSSAAGGGGAAAAGFGRPAASGQIAAITGSTMQVQNAQSGQVAVSWTAATKFTDTVATTLASVRPGDCITATAASAASSSSSPAPATSSASGSSTAPLAATVLMVTQPVNGQCGAGARGGAGGAGRSGFPSGASTRTRPSGAPTGGFARRAGDFATGTVSSVSANTVVVAAQQFGSTSTTDRSVTVTAQTKITTTQASTPGALKVGRCVSAQGSTDSTGAVSASTVRVTDPVNGQCTGGFTGGFGGGGGGNNGGGTGG